ncbi:MAG: hypothetical protein ABI199_04600 [Bacteroidia bacterium]
MNKTITKNKKSTIDVQKEEGEKLFFEPSENVIRNILNYSKALSIRKLRNDGYVEMLLN